MPTKAMPALGTDGRRLVVLKQTPAFRPRYGQKQQSMSRYSLSTGEELTPTGEPDTFRTLDGSTTLTLEKIP